MEKIFLTIYILTIGFILMSILLGLAFDLFYNQSKKNFHFGCGLVIITGVTHALTILWV